MEYLFGNLFFVQILFQGGWSISPNSDLKLINQIISDIDNFDIKFLYLVYM